MTVKIRLRRGTAAQWTSANPVLSPGEAGYETDTGKIKYGNGSNTWAALPYFLGNVDDTADANKNVLSAVNATNATKLATARTINGVSFDGTANITFPAIQRSVQTITAPTTLANAANTDYVVFSNQDLYPTSGDPTIAQTVTILHMDGANGSTTFTNSAPGKANWNAVGGAQIQTTTKKFGTGAFSNGTGRYLQAPTSLQTDLTFGTGDFTIEGHFYLGSVGNSTGDVPMFDWRPGNDRTNTSYFAATYMDGGGPGIGWFQGQTLKFANYGSFQSALGWYHVAFARQSGTLRMFVNGSLQATLADTTNYLCSSASMPNIGAWPSDSYWSARPFDEIRITKGLARYTAAFTAPTAAFLDTYVVGQTPQITLPTAVGHTNEYTIKNNNSSAVPLQTTLSQTVDGAPVNSTGDTNLPAVTALLYGDGANGSTVITDSSPIASNWTAVGTASLNTATKQFGTGSISFNGGYITPTAASSNFAFGGNNFTVEFWYRSNANGDIVLANWHSAGANPARYPMIYPVGGNMSWYVGGVSVVSAGTLAANAWHHVAFCRSGTTIRAFANGTLVNSATDTNDYLCDSNRPLFGGYTPGSGAYWFNGFLDDFRITKGVARYTSSFAVPTAAFPNTVATAVQPLSTLRLVSDGSNWRTV